MFQKEVADRIIAFPHSKMYGRLSIICQTYMKCRRLFDIPASAFTPIPKVISTVVEFIPHPFIQELPFHFHSLEHVTHIAFGQRRKMLRASLKSLFSNTEETLKILEIKEENRAENLTIDDFKKLAHFYENKSTT